MTVPRTQPPRKRRRSRFRFLFAVAVTTVMIATSGFGAFPDNSLTQMFQTVIGENFSADFLQPFNSYMENISAPTIQPQPDSVSEPAFDLIGTLAGPANPTAEALSTLSLEEINTSIANFSASMTSVSAGTATAVATLNTVTPPSTSTFLPTLTLLLSETPTIIPTWTFSPIIIYPTNTTEVHPPPPDTETATSTSTSTATATATYTPTATATVTFTATATHTLIPSFIILYSGTSSDGNIGPRSSADALCTANLPSGYTRYHAFIGYSAADNIANMPSNYGISTSLPILSKTNVVIGNNWADLLDGTIAVTLGSASVVNYYWWSGAENGGSSIDGVTADCNEWTSNANFGTNGNYGDYQFSNSAWMKGASGGACNQVLAILCVAY